MYEYRKMTPEQQIDLVQQRLALGYPPHSPPRFARKGDTYLLTAACYEHYPFMISEERRVELLDKLFEHLITAGHEIDGWVVLPNHYHLLVWLATLEGLNRIFGLIHGGLSRKWNLEDNTLGRKMWEGFTDRAMRSERHYYTTLNYIHYNPVKHGYVSSPYDWTRSSVHWYRKQFKRQWLRDLWCDYPVRQYGKGWDDF